MSYQIAQGKFDPQKEFVDVAGTFNNWGAQQLKLSDSNSDQIYEAVFNIPVSTAIEYKFRINGLWTGREEFPGGGSNRNYTVTSGSNYILVWYNNEVPPDAVPKADFTSGSVSLFENGTVNFQDRSAGTITKREWFFEGGQPTVSAETNPAVYYSKAGAYKVSLIVSGPAGKDTLTRPGYITVRKRETQNTSWWNNSVFYEIFVRSFYDSDGNGTGDFKGITQKLDYLKDLGISGIWLMPINPSPSYHGYDVTNYREVNPAYGTMNDFKQLVAEAHKRGIRIIIDYVMNHSSNQHPWFQQSAANNPAYRNFYRWSDTNPGYSGPLGTAWFKSSTGYYYGVFNSAMPDLNYEEPALKDSIFSSADFWLKDAGIDGFRLDAVLYLMEEGTQGINTQGTYNLLRDFSAHIKAAKPDAFAVGEAWTNTSTVVNYVINNRLDYCFEFDLASAILSAVNSGNTTGLTAQIQNVWNSYPYLQYGTFLTNHDQNRAMSMLSTIAKAKTAASIYLTLPGIPYLYYGEEIGMSGSKPDEYIRTPMQWNGNSNAGFTTGNPWIRVNADYPWTNTESELADSASILQWYKKLIALRNQEAALRLGDYEGLACSAQSVLAFMRKYQDKTLLIIVNTGKDAQNNIKLTMRSSMKPGTYSLTELLYGKANAYAVLNSNNELSGLSIGGMTTLVYSLSNGPETGVESGNSAATGFSLEQNYPNPFNPSTMISYSIGASTRVELRVYDMLGREAALLVNQIQNPGSYNVKFDASALPSGVYICKIQAGSFSSSRKLILIK
ncbi:MAG: alpha-amylase family glycosyl hydrolase [Syntrophothermus sp.]